MDHSYSSHENVYHAVVVLQVRFNLDPFIRLADHRKSPLFPQKVPSHESNLGILLFRAGCSFFSLLLCDCFITIDIGDLFHQAP